MEKAGFYIHIPFCVQKCLYCDFLSFAGRFHFAEAYTDQLCREMESKAYWARTLEFDSIFIGGGTPSSIPPAYISKILNHARKIFPFTDTSEISIEINPGTVFEDGLQSYREMGINRVSMGVQSTSDRLLRSMGRIHRREEAWASALSISNHFTNMNLDFISGIPGINGEKPQTMEEIEDDLSFAHGLNVPHVSIYSMITEPDTPLYHLTEAGRVIPCNEDTERDMYHKIRKYLTDHGYLHYEISNFALPGHICRHNMKYWQGKPYLGVGLGSASFLPGKGDTYVRTTNETDFEQYLNRMNFQAKDQEEIALEERKREYMMLGFRLISGPDPQLYTTLFQSEMRKDFRLELEKLVGKGLIQENGSLTEKGLDFANEISREFV